MTEETKTKEQPKAGQLRQATLAECNRQMIKIFQNERKLVSMKGPAGIITVPANEITNYYKQGYQVVETAPNADSGDGGQIKYDYLGVQYSAEELAGLAQKAGLPGTIKKPETIIAKLTEIDFDPNADSGE